MNLFEKVAILRVLLSSLVRKQDIDDNLGALRAEHAHLLLLSANTNFSRSLIKNLFDTREKVGEHVETRNQRGQSISQLRKSSSIA